MSAMATLTSPLREFHLVPVRIIDNGIQSRFVVLQQRSLTARPDSQFRRSGREYAPAGGDPTAISESPLLHDLPLTLTAHPLVLLLAKVAQSPRSLLQWCCNWQTQRSRRFNGDWP
jgi:hypothetical protein